MTVLYIVKITGIVTFTRYRHYAGEVNNIIIDQSRNRHCFLNCCVLKTL